MDEKTLQEKSRDFVGKEVLCSANTLIYELRAVAEQLEDYETYANLQTGLPEYEEVGRNFIMDDADLEQLEEIAEENGYWDAVLEESGVPEVAERESGRWCFEGSAECFDDEEDAKEAAINSVMKVVRQKVADLVSDWKEVCETYNLEADALDVYEHWVVSDWLARLLSEKGERVERYLGLMIWGRCTTGQSIYMDGVIQEIVKENES